MKVNHGSGGNHRIFAKALNSALRPSAFQRGPVMPPSTQNHDNLMNKGNELSPPTNVFQPTTPYMLSLVENSVLEAIDETLRMVPENSADEWARENRLQALNQLKSYQDKPVTKLSTLYTTDSIGKKEPLKPSNQLAVSSKTVLSRSETTISKPKIGFIDSHCHLDILFHNTKFKGTYAEFMKKHKKSYPETYMGCITVFCRPLTFSKVSMWQSLLANDNVWGAFGVHPKNANEYDEEVEMHLETALRHPKVKALGEIGLDYSSRNKSSRSQQHIVFRRQLRMAYDRRLPIVIHCRDAEDDTIRILHEILPMDYVFHLHCFTGTWKSAQRWMNEFHGAYIGITNLVTFPDAKATHEVARNLPCDRLLLETDAPYFVPRVFPKKQAPLTAHPGMAIHVATRIAELKKVPVAKILECTQKNTRYVYRL